MKESDFIIFTKPFIDALQNTFKTMVSTDIKAHSPKLKTTSVAKGDISAIIGMNGVKKVNDSENEFKGLLVLTWPEDVYLKIAGAMLFEDFEEYCEEISDSGAEISNIVMGNAKSVLVQNGFHIDMATPTTVRGKDHEVKYPTKATVIEITISCDYGDFNMEICYQQID